MSGTSDEPLDRPLANVGAVWYAHERERKPGYPKGLRVLLENVFQNDVVHAVMSKQAVEHYEGVDAIPEGGARTGRTLTLAGRLDDYPAVMEVRDYWKSPTSVDQLMLSAAFTDVIFNDPQRKLGAPKAKANPVPGEALTVRLTITNSRVERGHVMGVIGSSAALGKGHSVSARMQPHQGV